MKRNPIFRFAISLLLGLICTLPAMAQTNPYFNQTDTLPIAPAKVDTAKNIGHIYPRYNGISIGTNIASPVMRLFGQDYSSYEVMIEANLYNRFFPEVSFGIGSADGTNDQGMRYQTTPSFFGRIGMNYNFLYNKDRPNAVFASIRYGYSAHKASITCDNVSDGFWPGTTDVSIQDEAFSSHWVELGAGIRIEVLPWLHMGWMLYYKPMISSGKTKLANPWYIPGYGANGNGFGFAYNIFFKIPPRNKKEKK